MYTPEFDTLVWPCVFSRVAVAFVEVRRKVAVAPFGRLLGLHKGVSIQSWNGLRH